MYFVLSLLMVCVVFGTYGVSSKVTTDSKDDIVHIKLYYEVLCPDCVKFDSTKFKKVVLLLSPRVAIETYPYGHANTTVDQNGKISFQCQHGEEECYGNRLHACALDILTNHTEALLYNICMMEDESGGKSDDKAAEKCGEKLSVDSAPIKDCAKSRKGMELLKHYGEETGNIETPHVPWIFVNGELVNRHGDFFGYVCQQFRHPPSACQDN